MHSFEEFNHVNGWAKDIYLKLNPRKHGEFWCSPGKGESCVLLPKSHQEQCESLPSGYPEQQSVLIYRVEKAAG